jgi:hypothetical protein
MPIDSTANLLFSIGANSDDAEENIQRFRTLLSKDLGDITGEFADWSREVLGDLSTVQGATTAAAAAVAAAVVGIGAVMQESTNRYAEFVSQIDRGSRVTGISVERMSGLKFAADETHTSYDALVTGLTRFSSTIVKAAEGGEQQEKAFARLGISQEQVKAGEKDMMPLLEAVADRFKGLGSQVDKTAIARELFGRGGAELVRILSQGSEGLREFTKEAAAMGLEITTKDVVAVNEYRAAVEKAKAMQEALDVTMGRESIGIMEMLQVEWAGLIQTIKEGGASNLGSFLTMWKTNNSIIQQQIHELAESLARVGETGGGNDPAAVPQKLKEEYRGLSELLSEITGKVWDIAGGEEGKIDTQIEHLNDELNKAKDQFIKLRSEGKLTADDIKTQSAALMQLPQALATLAKALQQEYGDKLVAAVRNAGTELQEMTLRQGKQTVATKDELLTLEVAKRRAAMEQEHTDTAENLAWLAAYEQAARQKITDEKIAEIEKSGAAIAEKQRTIGERSYEERKAELNREMDALLEKDRKEGEGVANHEAEIEALRKAGLAKIAADQKAAFDQESARLDEQLEKIEERHQTAQQRIAAQYDADVAKFSAAEEKKTLSMAVNEAQRAAIVAQFAAIRKALLDKEGADLQQLLNSQGWQGVFGAKFGELIRGNEELTKQWASSTNQSAMMVKVTLEGLKEVGEKAFESLAQGMGGNIAHAIVYSKSIKEAMKAALESTLENLAGQAFTYAIYSTALGFTDLAEGNEPGAAAAFTAAGTWAAVGAAAGLAGRALQGGPGGSAAGAGGSAGPGTNAANTKAIQSDQSGMAVGPNAASGGPHVTVNVYGHVVGTSGVAEFAGMLNDAVMNSDVQLTATNTKTGVQVNQ